MAVEDDVILKRCDKIEEHYYDVKHADDMGGTITLRFVNDVFQGIKLPKASFTLNHELITAEELEKLHFLLHEVEARRNNEKR